MQRRTASLVLASLLVLSLGHRGRGGRPDVPGTATLLVAACLPRPPPCRRCPTCAHVYVDIKTRFRDLSDWRQTLVDTRLRVGSSYKPKDLVSVSQANIGGSGKVRQHHHR